MRGSRKKNKKMSQSQKDFVAGKTNTITLASPTKKLGYSPTLQTQSGSGLHGGDNKARKKKERRESKESLRNYKNDY